MYLKYTMYKPNIYTVWYIECISIFDKIWMRKYPWKCFHNIGLPLKFSIDVSSETFL